MAGVHHSRKTALATITAVAVLGCADAARPVAPPQVGPALAANPLSPSVVHSIVGLQSSGGSSWANDINDEGQVVGAIQGTEGSRAAIWNSVSVLPVNLGTLPGGHASEATAIDPSGTVVVGWSDAFDFVVRATRWRKINGTWTIQALQWLPSRAFDVAADGAIVGTIATLSGPRGFLWRNGNVTDLGAAGVSGAETVNGSGQVAGVNMQAHAITWTAAGGTIPLGSLGGSASFAGGINESGHIVGGARTSANELHAFLWAPTRRTTNGMVDLGTLGGPSSSARGINAAGQVVGWSLNTADAQRAVVWSKGKIHDLGALPGYAEAVARAINNEKQIVGWSETTGGARATLWTLE